MTGKDFRLDIVTPQKLVFSGEVTSFTAPGVLGGFQILHDHAPMLTALRIGQVKVVMSDGKVLHFATSGGFVEVHDNIVIMLAETAVPASDVEVEKVQAAIASAQQKLHEARTPEDVELLRETIMKAKNQLVAAKKVSE